MENNTFVNLKLNCGLEVAINKVKSNHTFIV